MNAPCPYRIIKKIKTGGSDREFYRVIRDGTPYILIQGKRMSEYLSVRNHLSRLGVAVPGLYSSARNQAIVEDLGDRSLYRISSGSDGIKKTIYRRVIKELVKLQIDGRRGFPFARRYDEDHVRWEQNYFSEYFLGQYCGLSNGARGPLERDFMILTRDVIFWNESFNGYLMHRDFQSQNIIFKNGRPRFIDFQSARLGPLTYDLASLLRDSYLTISERFEDSMINLYLDELKNYGIAANHDAFIKAYRLAGLQRNMQSLGAFANLTLNKGKPFFRRYIPRGVFLLRAGLRHNPYPVLNRVIERIAYAK